MGYTSYPIDTMIYNNKHLNNNDVGFLKLIMGPMFAGKTSSIIELTKKYKYTNMNILVINYAEDKRYSENMLSTHDNIVIPCLNLLNLKDVLSFIDNGEMVHKIEDEGREDETDVKQVEKDVNYNVILINEAQFFPDLKEVVIKLVEKYCKIVYIFGLDGDFKRNGFTPMMELIPYADEIEKKYSICKNCKDGTRALFSHRLSNETEIKVIGSSNYIPLCRKCYLEFNNVI